MAGEYGKSAVHDCGKKKKRKTIVELSEMADQLLFMLDKNTSCEAEKICVISFMHFGNFSRASYFTGKAHEKKVKECKFKKDNLEQKPTRGVS